MDGRRRAVGTEFQFLGQEQVRLRAMRLAMVRYRRWVNDEADMQRVCTLHVGLQQHAWRETLRDTVRILQIRQAPSAT